ncbi:DUF1841 family protein [Thiomicrospira microaerophila]|uniref:DUF1841 family protein n=1 Tax=Thiomicrospira microaerophila TaxID=406020 RepID=UPI00200F67B9|nr:DUF1841 family protein [Thiomicrospira microaerophila]UQB41552.1 DUF1841 family protein [Thiomicrospira microaerophila]
MYTSERDKLRQHYADIWQKARNNQPLDALEKQIALVIEQHPEYHKILENRQHIKNEYLPEMGETNPFLHMGMHLGIREQVATDRPSGIAQVHKKLSLKLGSMLEAEHAMMDCLAEALWNSQKYQQAPDEMAYSACLQKLIKG